MQAPLCIRRNSRIFSQRVGALSVCFLMLCSGFGQLRPAVRAAIRDSQAVQAVQSSIAAMGGLPLLTSLRNVTMQGESTMPDGATEQLKWMNDFTKPYPEFRKEGTDGSRVTVLASGHGKPEFHDGTKVHALPMHVLLSNRPYHLPGIVLLRELSDPKYSIEWVGTETLNGVSVLHVKCERTDDPVSAAITPQEWYFNSSTLLPLRVEYQVPIVSNSLRTVPAGVEYSDYRNESGVLLPFTLHHLKQGRPSETITVSSHVFNTELQAADFEVPGGAQ